MAQEVFRRYEKKYRITMEKYQKLMGQMMTRMLPDQYGKHTICNIYLDTEDYRLIRTSLEKPVYKEKLRLRSYGTPSDADTVFLELKKKYDGVVYKRRAELSMQEAGKYLYYGIRPEHDSQIMREIDYAIQFYEARPKVCLSYDRIAFSGKDDPELRVTFDMNIRARDYQLDLRKGVYGALLLGEKELLMEVKIPGAMPLWMSHLFAQLEIYPTSFSKYGTFYEKQIAPACGKDHACGQRTVDFMRGGIACA